MPQRHLVTVWNPQYAPEAMDQHLGVLLDWARRRGEGTAEDDDVYVWWGKLASANRQRPMPHRDEVLALNAQAEAEETHLYLTDYRSLYVAHLGAVEGDDVRKDPAEKGHIPDYYFGREEVADCWFLLWDIRRLVSDDTVSVVHELQNLRNTRYHDKPVSIYGGMVELPLIVSESAPRRYFDAEYRDHLTDQRLWAEFDAERTGVRSLEREIRENLFGDAAWLRLDHLARQFVATAEKIWRDHADDSAFDCSPVLVQLCKALEVTGRGVVEAALRRAEPSFVEKLKSRDVPVDYSRYHPSLTDLGKVLTELGRDRREKGRLREPDATWLTGELPGLLARLAHARGPTAHAAAGDRKSVSQWRRELLGIGCEGMLVRLAMVELG